MKDAFEFLAKLLADELTVEERRVGWKLLSTVGYRVVMIFVTCWGYGVFQIFGWGDGFARADDVEKRIEEAIRPVFEQQKRQGDTLLALRGLLNEQLASTAATEIRYLVAKRCPETDPYERERIQREIERKQDEYKRFRDRDERYNFGCSDV